MINFTRLKIKSNIRLSFSVLLFSFCSVFLLTTSSAQPDDSERQFQEIADTLAIQKLLGQYMNFVDTGEFEEYANLFAEDGELIFQSFHLTGREEIFTLMNRGAQPDPSAKPSPPTLVHTMSNNLIELDGNEATHLARWINMSPNEEGQPVMRATGLYKDKLIKIRGEWKIQQRIVTNEIPYVETTYMSE